LRGWRCVYVPAAVVYHKFSAGGEPFSAFKALLTTGSPHTFANRLRARVPFGRAPPRKIAHVGAAKER
jgi:GT2 family glycosyltransferase